MEIIQISLLLSQLSGFEKLAFYPENVWPCLTYKKVEYAFLDCFNKSAHFFFYFICGCF